MVVGYLVPDLCYFRVCQCALFPQACPDVHGLSCPPLLELCDFSFHTCIVNVNGLHLCSVVMPGGDTWRSVEVEVAAKEVADRRACRTTSMISALILL